METIGVEETTGREMRWYEVWIDVITHPRVETFQRILADPTASEKRGFIWVAVMAIIVGIAQALLLKILPFASTYGQEITEAYAPFLAVVCAPIGAIIGLAIGAGVQHGIARLLGGQGNFGNLVYCTAAYTAPLSIISFLLSSISTMLSVGQATNLSRAWPVWLFVIALGIYEIVLNVQALVATEKISSSRALAVLLIPAGVVLLLGGCLALFGVFASGTH